MDSNDKQTNKQTNWQTNRQTYQFQLDSNDQQDSPECLLPEYSSFQPGNPHTLPVLKETPFKIVLKTFVFVIYYIIETLNLALMS